MLTQNFQNGYSRRDGFCKLGHLRYKRVAPGITLLLLGEGLGMRAKKNSPWDDSLTCGWYRHGLQPLPVVNALMFP
jgi:hypothetical protein